MTLDEILTSLAQAAYDASVGYSDWHKEEHITEVEFRRRHYERDASLNELHRACTPEVILKLGNVIRAARGISRTSHTPDCHEMRLRAQDNLEPMLCRCGRDRLTQALVALNET